MRGLSVGTSGIGSGIFIELLLKLKKIPMTSLETLCWDKFCRESLREVVRTVGIGCQRSSAGNMKVSQWGSPGYHLGSFSKKMR